MYQQMAAFAAALILRPERYVKASILDPENPIWGISATGGSVYTNLAGAHKLSILGAMRAAQEHITSDPRAYNTLDSRMRQVARTLYGSATLGDLEHGQAIKVLLMVAK